MRCDWNCPCPGYKEGMVERNLWREVKEGEGLKILKIEEFYFELLWSLEIFLWIRCCHKMDYTCTYPGTLARIENSVSELELLLLLLVRVAIRACVEQWTDLGGQGHPHLNDLAGIETCATSGQAVARRGIGISHARGSTFQSLSIFVWTR